MTKEQYICQRAATAIISEIGPYKISSDALQSVNQFLDEVLYLLLKYANSLDLSIIKAQVLSLLPLSLGKNAIVEAELEVKTYTETNVIDYAIYENLRKINPSVITLDQLFTILRHQCIECCTLADKTTTPTTNVNKNNDDVITISPMVVIYITTVLEHTAEYVLTTTAVTAENENTEYVRNKEIYIALLDDVQVGELFRQTDIRMKLEKRVITYQSQHQYQSMILPSPAPSPITSYNKQQSSQHELYDRTSDPYIDYSQESLEDDINSEPLPSSAHTRSSFSIKSGQSSHYRPVSVLSNATATTVKSSSSSKKGFRLFGKKDKRSSTVSQSTIQQRPTSPIPSNSPSAVQIYDPDAPALDFEDLIRSGNTMKVSLTPTRLRSIEVKSNLSYESSSNLSKHSSSTSIPYPNSMKSPTSPNNIIPFENPRAAPKPPTQQHPSTIQNNKQTPPLTPNSSITSRLSDSRSPPPPPPRSSSSFEDDDNNNNNNNKQQQKGMNGKYTKQPPPAPLQLNGSNRQRSPSSSLKQSQHYERDDQITSDNEDIYITDLPSPPNTTGYRSSMSNFSITSDNGKQQQSPQVPNSRSSNELVSSPSTIMNKPRFPRPSSMVAKRASSSSRPTSFHESFALSMEHQQGGGGSVSDLALIQALSSSSPGLASSASEHHNPLTFPIGTNHLRSATPPPSSTGSTTTNTTDGSRPSSPPPPQPQPTSSTSMKTVLRRRTARPISQLITIEDVQEPKVEEMKRKSGSLDEEKVIKEENEKEKEQESQNEMGQENTIVKEKEEQGSDVNDDNQEIKSTMDSTTTTTTTTNDELEKYNKIMNSESIRNLESLLADDTAFYNSSHTSYDRRDRILQLLQQKHQLLKNNSNPKKETNNDNDKENNLKGKFIDSSMQTDPIPGLPPLSALLLSMSSTSISNPSSTPPDVIVTKIINESSSLSTSSSSSRSPSSSSLMDHDSLLLTKQQSGITSNGSEKGMIDGDEEWFMQDEDWEDAQEQDTMMAEWLLGEA